MDVTGAALTSHLVELIERSGATVESAGGRDCVDAAKETICFVSLDPSVEPTPSMKSFILPDGQEVRISKERWMCPEALFDPSLMDSESMGIHKMVARSIADCKVKEEEKRLMFRNIVLSGGTTLIPGLPERLTREL